MAYMDFRPEGSMLKMQLDDKARDSETRRQVRASFAGQEQSAGLRCVALLWLGRRLVAWGSQLQEQHTATGQQALSQTYNH